LSYNIAGPSQGLQAPRGRLPPGRDDPAWAATPLKAHQQLWITAHQLMTPVRGPLKQPGIRRLLTAVRAAGRMRMTGAHWLALPTAEREALGSPRSQLAAAFCQALENLVGRHPQQPPAPAGEPAGAVG
jgi:hypothetical protein